MLEQPPSPPPAIAGYCPMGGRKTLAIEHGQITCTDPQCPRPTAAAEILADHEPEHIVTLHRGTFTVRHPLRERLDDALMTCPLHAWIRAQNQPPRPLGRYRVAGVGNPSTATWAEVDDDAH